MNQRDHLALDFQNVSKTIGKTSILSDIHASIFVGDIVGIIGPNGSGKSTFLSLINRTIIDYTGNIYIMNREHHTLSDRQLAQMVAWVPPISIADFHFTVADVIAMARFPHTSGIGRLSAHDRHIVSWSASLCGVSAFLDRDLSSLSSGEQQRVHLARAIAQETPILLLDEALSHLDYHHRATCMSALSTLVHDRHVTILIVSHDVNDLGSFCNRMIGLKNGRIHCMGNASDPTILSEESLSTLFDAPIHYRSGFFV